MTKLTARFDDALTYAHQVHGDQVRKGNGAPYIGHLMGVASIVLDDGGSEDEAIGALLHDAAEDQGGRTRLDEIRSKFGDAVAAIVEDCTDSWETPKRPWIERKREYIKHAQRSARRACGSRRPTRSTTRTPSCAISATRVTKCGAGSMRRQTT